MSKKIRILVVDDEPDLREILADEFRFAEAEVFEAANGVDALAVYHSEKPDAVVSDIRMPGGDGVTLAKTIKAGSPAEAKVFLITGFADLTAAQAYNFGVDGFFTKPFHLEEVREAVMGSLRSAQERWGKSVVDDGKTIPVVLSSSDYKRDFSSGQYELGRGGFFLPQAGMSQPSLVLRTGQRIELRSGAEKLGVGIVRWVRAESNDQKLGCGVEFIALEPSFLQFILSLDKVNTVPAFIPA